MSVPPAQRVVKNQSTEWPYPLKIEKKPFWWYKIGEFNLLSVFTAGAIFVALRARKPCNSLFSYVTTAIVFMESYILCAKVPFSKKNVIFPSQLYLYIYNSLSSDAYRYANWIMAEQACSGVHQLHHFRFRVEPLCFPGSAAFPFGSWLDAVG